MTFRQCRLRESVIGGRLTSALTAKSSSDLDELLSGRFTSLYRATTFTVQNIRDFRYTITGNSNYVCCQSWREENRLMTIRTASTKLRGRRWRAARTSPPSSASTTSLWPS